MQRHILLSRFESLISILIFSISFIAEGIFAIVSSLKLLLMSLLLLAELYILVRLLLLFARK